jgi:hypothetical protein
MTYIKKEKVDYHQKLKDKLGDFNQYAEIGRYTDKTNSKMNNYMKAFYLDNNIVWPEISNNCACGHWIIKQCYIQHIETKEIIVVGDCCINKFKIKKKCIECNQNHGRTKFNICKNCEDKRKEELKESKILQKKEKELEKEIEKYDNKILKFSKHKYKTYKYIYDNHLDFIEWCYKKYLEYQEETRGDCGDTINNCMWADSNYYICDDCYCNHPKSSSDLFNDIVFYYKLKRQSVK